MFQADWSDCVAVMPAPAQPAGAALGFFADANPVAQTDGSAVRSEFLNMVMIELLNVLPLGGVAADQTRVNYAQVAQAIENLVARPLAALRYPTIATTNNTVGATGASVAGVGGTVSIPAGVMLTLGKEVVAGQTAREKVFTTAAWTSANLNTATTYYLRAQAVNGVFTPYVQIGTDTDAIPAGLKGTPNGVNGGGFDSTVLDILLAKVVTGAAGSVPTITNLANAAVLKASFTYAGSAANGSTNTHTYNWGRVPTIAALAALNGNQAAGTDTDTQVNILTPTRYSCQVGTSGWDPSNSHNTGPGYTANFLAV